MSDTKVRRNIDVDWLGKPITCPDREQHTEEPIMGYSGFFIWAARMDKTHRQTKCSGCGRYRIWKKREDRR